MLVPVVVLVPEVVPLPLPVPPPPVPPPSLVQPPLLVVVLVVVVVDVVGPLLVVLFVVVLLFGPADEAGGAGTVCGGLLAVTHLPEMVSHHVHVPSAWHASDGGGGGEGSGGAGLDGHALPVSTIWPLFGPPRASAISHWPLQVTPEDFHD